MSDGLAHKPSVLLPLSCGWLASGAKGTMRSGVHPYCPRRSLRQHQQVKDISQVLWWI